MAACNSGSISAATTPVPTLIASSISSRASSTSFQLAADKRWLRDGFIADALGGWKIGGIISVVSGTPFTVTANGGTINTLGETQTANLVGRYRVLHGIGPNSPWFDTTAFGQPAGCPASPAPCPLDYGNVLGDTGRNQFTGPGYIQDNLSVYKKFRIREGVELEARADAFQLSNTPQFNNPSASITSSTFGKDQHARQRYWCERHRRGTRAAVVRGASLLSFYDLNRGTALSQAKPCCPRQYELENCDKLLPQSRRTFVARNRRFSAQCPHSPVVTFSAASLPLVSLHRFRNSCLPS